MEKKIEWKKTIIKLFIGVLIIILFLALVFLALHLMGYDKITKEALQEIVNSTGIYGKLIFIILSFLQVTFIPIPAAITIISGNILFGFWEGFFLSFIGILFGSIVSFLLGRVIGRRFVNWAFGDKETVDYYLEKIKGKEVVLLFFMFLLPCFPDDALCSIAGITNIKTSIFVVMQLITRVTSILGTLFFMSGEIIPYKGWGLIIIILVAILAIIAFMFTYKNAEKINTKLENISLKITNIFNKKDKE